MWISAKPYKIFLLFITIHILLQKTIGILLSQSVYWLKKIFKSLLKIPFFQKKYFSQNIDHSLIQEKIYRNFLSKYKSLNYHL